MGHGIGSSVICVAEHSSVNERKFLQNEGIISPQTERTVQFLFVKRPESSVIS